MNKDGYAVRGWLHGLVEGSCSLEEAEEVINNFIRIAHQKGKSEAGLDLILTHNSKKCSEKDKKACLSELDKETIESYQYNKNSGING